MKFNTTLFTRALGISFIVGFISDYILFPWIGPAYYLAVFCAINIIPFVTFYFAGKRNSGYVELTATVPGIFLGSVIGYFDGLLISTAIGFLLNGQFNFMQDIYGIIYQTQYGYPYLITPYGFLYVFLVGFCGFTVASRRVEGDAK
jgi:hypothetical protein